MNLWECDHSNCQRTAHGVGGAAGLKAIGWYWESKDNDRSILLCPEHWPEDKRGVIPQHCLFQRTQMCTMINTCSYCTASNRADQIQIAFLGANPSSQWDNPIEI